MKTTIKFKRCADNIMRVAKLDSLVHKVPTQGWTLNLYTPNRDGGWFLFEEDENGNQTGEAIHFPWHADAVKYARELYDNNCHLPRDYQDRAMRHSMKLQARHDNASKVYRYDDATVRYAMGDRLRPRP